MANFTIGDYKYETLTTNTVCAYGVVDKTKSTYSNIPTSVTYSSKTYDVVSLEGCFSGCQNLVTAPSIPDNVTNMISCFYGCVNLEGVTNLPKNLIYMGACFYNCLRLRSIPTIPESVINMALCFSGCYQLDLPQLPSKVKSIDSCFEYCIITKELIIPNSVTTMARCFYNCEWNYQPPEIPNSVTNMSECFAYGDGLEVAPVIPSSVTNLYRCFMYCEQLAGDVYIYANNLVGINAHKETFAGIIKPVVIHAMNNNTSICQLLATSEYNNSVYVNVHPEEEITFVDTEMKYKNGDKTETLSLQTNANLVQCEIPDLVNGGTITTNVNDALIDLYKRGVFD